MCVCVCVWHDERWWWRYKILRVFVCQILFNGMAENSVALLCSFFFTVPPLGPFAVSNNHFIRSWMKNEKKQQNPEYSINVGRTKARCIEYSLLANGESNSSSRSNESRKKKMCLRCKTVPRCNFILILNRFVDVIVCASVRDVRTKPSNVYQQCI